MLKGFMKSDVSGFFIGEYDEITDVLDNAALLMPIAQGQINMFAFPGQDFQPQMVSIEGVSKKSLYAIDILELDEAAKKYWELRKELLSLKAKKVSGGKRSGEITLN